MQLHLGSDAAGQYCTGGCAFSPSARFTHVEAECIWTTQGKEVAEKLFMRAIESGRIST